MKADELLNWDKAELAGILAELFADEEDLMEAFPSIENAHSLDLNLLDGFIEKHWGTILRHFDLEKLRKWVEEKEWDEELKEFLNDWSRERFEDEMERDEDRDEEYIWSVLYAAALFRDIDPWDLGVLISQSRKA